MTCTCHHPWANAAAEHTRSSSGMIPEESIEMGRLGRMHHGEDFIGCLQDEIRTGDQELTTADDGCHRTLARKWYVTEGSANGRRLRMNLFFDQRILPF